MRWVETNKGDDSNPNIRSRLVAREIRTAGQDAIFAPTPPLESLRMVLSYAASDIGKKHDRRPGRPKGVPLGRQVRDETLSCVKLLPRPGWPTKRLITR